MSICCLLFDIGVQIRGKVIFLNNLLSEFFRQLPIGVNIIINLASARFMFLIIKFNKLIRTNVSLKFRKSSYETWKQFDLFKK